MAEVDYQQIATQCLKAVYAVVGTLLIALWGAVKALLPASVLGQQDVQDKLVLITGGGSGFGRALAVRFAKLGSRIILWDMNEKGNQETAEMCKKFGVEVHCYTCDISDPKAVYAAAAKVKTEVGDVEILINNAGIVQGKSITEITDTKVTKTMEVNANAHFWIIKSFLPSMLEKNEGHIVAVSSAAGLFGAPFLSDYCASKFAVCGLMESLKVELLKKEKLDIGVTVICPTYMDTGMFPNATMPLMPMMDPEYVADKAVEGILLRRFLVMIPRLVYLLYFVKGFMPVEAQLFLATQLGVHTSMDGFIAHKDKESKKQ